MAISEDKWFEVWFAEGVDVIPSELLIVTPDPSNPGQILVTDVFEKLHYQAKDYEAAKHWLLEDEYSLANGREFPDDGW